jgi:hypothetical protein
MAGFGRFKVIAADYRMPPRPSLSGRARQADGKLPTAGMLIGRSLHEGIVVLPQ